MRKETCSRQAENNSTGDSATQFIAELYADPKRYQSAIRFVRRRLALRRPSNVERLLRMHTEEDILNTAVLKLVLTAVGAGA